MSIINSWILKWQKVHISVKCPLIKKISVLYFLQLLKLKIRKWTYFHDRRTTWLVMKILLFQEETGLPLKSHKMTKSSYLPQMTSDQKNNGTLFSSTFKVEDKKLHLFSWSEVNLISYDHFVVSWRNWITPHKSQNDKTLISHLNDLWSKK